MREEGQEGEEGEEGEAFVSGARSLASHTWLQPVASCDCYSPGSSIPAVNVEALG